MSVLDVLSRQRSRAARPAVPTPAPTPTPSPRERDLVQRAAKAAKGVLQESTREVAEIFAKVPSLPPVNAERRGHEIEEWEWDYMIPLVQGLRDPDVGTSSKRHLLYEQAARTRRGPEETLRVAMWLDDYLQTGGQPAIKAPAAEEEVKGRQAWLKSMLGYDPELSLEDWSEFERNVLGKAPTGGISASHPHPLTVVPDEDYAKMYAEDPEQWPLDPGTHQPLADNVMSETQVERKGAQDFVPLTEVLLPFELGRRYVGEPAVDALAVPVEWAEKKLEEMGLPPNVASGIAGGLLPWSSLARTEHGRMVMEEVFNPANAALFLTPWAIGQAARGLRWAKSARYMEQAYGAQALQRGTPVSVGTALDGTVAEVGKKTVTVEFGHNTRLVVPIENVRVRPGAPMFLDADDAIRLAGEGKAAKATVPASMTPGEMARLTGDQAAAVVENAERMQLRVVEAPGVELKKATRMIVDNMTSNELDRYLLTESLKRAAVAPTVPRTILGSTFHWIRSLPAKNLRRIWAYEPNLAAAHYQGSKTVLTNTRTLAMERVLTESFGPAAIKNPLSKPLLSLYDAKAAAKMLPREVLESAAHQRNIGTVAHYLDVPELYRGATPLMQRAQRLYHGTTTSDLELSRRLGVTVGEIRGHYLPHRIAEDPSRFAGLMERASGALSGVQRRGRMGFAKPRKYPTLDEYAAYLEKEGLQVELDPVKLYARRLFSGARLQSEQVFLNGVRSSALKAGEAYVGKAAKPGYVALNEARMPGLYVTDDVYRDVMALTRPADPTSIARIASTSVDLLRGTLLNADISFLSIQGYALATVDPVKFLRNFVDSTFMLMTEEGYLMDMAQNLPRYAKAAQRGVTLHWSGIDLSRGVVRLDQSVLGKVPAIGQLNEWGFGRVLPKVKVMQWETMTEMLLNIQKDKTLLQRFFGTMPVAGKPLNRWLRQWGGVEGKSLAELEEMAAQVIDNIGGGIDWARIANQPGLGGKLLFLTEGWLRANAGRILMAATVGDPRGVLARRFIFQQLAISAMLSTAISSAWGIVPEFDPRDTHWLDVVVEHDGKRTYIPFVPGKTYLRTLARVVGGTPWEEGGLDERLRTRLEETFRFASGRRGQALGIIVDLEQGRDFIGRQVTEPWLHILKSLAPIVGQQIIEQYQYGEGLQADPDTLIALLPEVGGLGAISEQPVDRANRKLSELAGTPEGADFRDIATGKPIEDYYALTRTQQARFRELFPDLIRDIEEYGEVRQTEAGAAFKGVQEDRDSTIDQACSFFTHGFYITPGQEAIEGPPGSKNDGGRLVQAINEAQARYFRDRELLERQYGETDFDPDSEQGRIMDAYFEEVVKAAETPAGETDWDIYRDLDVAFRVKYGSAADRVLDEHLSYAKNPVYGELREGRLLAKPYWEYMDGLWQWGPALQASKLTSYAESGLAPDPAAYPNPSAYRAVLISTWVDWLEGHALSERGYAFLKGSRWTEDIQRQDPLTRAEALEIANHVATTVMKGWYDIEKVYREDHLKDHPDILAFLVKYDYYDPSKEMRPYLPGDLLE